MKNRIIKFRGRNIHTGEWVVGSLLSIEDTCFIIEEGDFDFDYRTEAHAFWFDCTEKEVDPDTVGQFVDVTDEHGKEVFEGDVLEADYKYDCLGYNGGVDPDNDCICYGVVEFDNNALQWALNIHKAEYPISKQIEEDGYSLFPLHIFGHEYGYDNCNLNIIGNIHDNPSLISDKQ